MQQSPPLPSRATHYWQFIVDGWPVIVAVLGISWAVAVFIADAYVAGIVQREYAKAVQTEPVIAALKNDITAINGSLANLEGNDTEIRAQLTTVVTRLDTLISIQLNQ